MSRKIVKEGLQNSVYMLVSQSINLILGIVRSVLLPIMLGLVNYGYWQVYILFLSFAGAFALGINDGIYLRYGKFKYQDLPKKKLRTTIAMFVFVQIIFVLVLSAFVSLENTAARRVAIQWAIINIPIIGLTGVLGCILQTTNQLKKFSLFAFVDKLLVLLLVFAILLMKTDNFIYIIYADTFARLFALCLMMWSCQQVIFGALGNIKEALVEMWDNFNIGIKVMISSLTGTLILTFGVFYVERTQPIEIYSLYSFSTSTIALVLILVTALGMVVYPTLSRIAQNKYARYYLKLNKLFNILIYFVLIIYYPVVIFISIFMKKYTGIFIYLPIIFGIILIQSKMQILINPYYKLLREESKMLKDNITGFLIALVLVVFSFQLFHSVIAVAAATFFAMLYRLLTMEKYLFKKMRIKKNVITIDILFVFYFIFCAYLPNLFISMVLYLVGYCAYVKFNFLKKSTIKSKKKGFRGNEISHSTKF